MICGLVSNPLDAAITINADIERYIKGTSIERIWYYQQSQDRWYAYYKNRTDQSTLTELKPDAVYWVLSSREQILTPANGSESGINSQKAYLHNNHLGSVAFETDESGAVSQASLYQPYGASSKDSNKASEKVSTYSFSGKEEDGSGLYYFEARYYDPVTTRFVSPDPLFAVDMEKCIESIIECNLYQYTGNNPVNFLDLLCLEKTISLTFGSEAAAVCDACGEGSDIGNYGFEAGLAVTVESDNGSYSSDINLESIGFVGSKSEDSDAKGHLLGASRLGPTLTVTDGSPEDRGKYDTFTTALGIVQVTHYSEANEYGYNDYKGFSVGTTVGLGYMESGSSQGSAMLPLNPDSQSGKGMLKTLLNISNFGNHILGRKTVDIDNGE